MYKYACHTFRVFPTYPCHPVAFPGTKETTHDFKNNQMLESAKGTYPKGANKHTCHVYTGRKKQDSKSLWKPSSHFTTQINQHFSQCVRYPPEAVCPTLRGTALV